MSTIAKGSIVLVTGANGYIASHVINQLLHAGYKVRGTVRSPSKAEWMHKLLDPQHGPDAFETVVVPDMVAGNAFDAAVKSVSGIVASGYYRDVQQPPLGTARKDAEADGFVVYAASKTEAEGAILEGMGILGGFCGLGGKGAGSMGSWVVSLIKGEREMEGLDVPPFHFIDVVNDARLHVAALIDPSCAGKRIFAFARPFNWNDVLAIFLQMHPDRKFRDNIKVGRDLSEVPNQEAEELLRKHYGHGWASLEESVKANMVTLA
ncbi:hypothetical protein LTR74_015797 [Friedmanniomyces endolithicus]|nr:hypothetical protein LTR74_015797 [Friedmanniomyces endolithicus]